MATRFHWKKGKICHLIFASLVIGFTLLQIYIQIYQFLYVPSYTMVPDETPQDSSTKYILFWDDAADFHGADDSASRISVGKEAFKDCKVFKDCYATNDKRFLSSVDKFDLIQFNNRETTVAYNLPKTRSPHQIYMLWARESPAYNFGFHSASFNGYFNWTFTYRRDSDIFRPYGVIRKLKPLPDGDKNELKDYIAKFGSSNSHLIEGRKKTAVWFVSHCGAISKRDDYVKELQRYIDVDIYGKCGNFTCPYELYEMAGAGDKCWAMIEKQYMFYLSFENSLCKDYITEKFYHAMNHSIVPISYGGAAPPGHSASSNDYHATAGAPEHSFIDALRDFPEPKSLAKYLIKLKSNPGLYAEYFWWKDFYSVEHQTRKERYCRVCEKLHNNNGQHQTIENLEHWWIDQSTCKPCPWPC